LSLLLDGSRLSVALGHDDSPQSVSKLARHFLIRRLAKIIAKAHFGVGFGRLKKDAPAIVGHLHVIKMRPAFRTDIDRGAQPNILLLKAFRPHVLPPTEKVWQPLFQRAL